MAAKAKVKAKAPLEWDPDDDMPPVKDPYPEFEDEGFEIALAMGVKPEQVTEPDRTKYKAWLAARARRN